MLKILTFLNSSGLYIYVNCPKKAGCYCKRKEILFLILHPSGYFCQVVTVWGSEKKQEVIAFPNASFLYIYANCLKKGL